MANLVITKSGNSIIVDFGSYALIESVDGKRASYKASDIAVVWLEKDESIVNVFMNNAVTTQNWQVSFSSEAGVFVVDTIDGIAPTDNIDLFNKLTALR